MESHGEPLWHEGFGGDGPGWPESHLGEAKNGWEDGKDQNDQMNIRDNRDILS